MPKSATPSLVAAFAVGLVVAWGPGAYPAPAPAQSPAAAKPALIRWEYKLHTGSNLEDLNRLGDEGWELTCAVARERAPNQYVFKRPRR